MEKNKKMLFITFIILLFCVIVILSLSLINMREKYLFIRNYNDNTFLSNFTNMSTSLAKKDTDDNKIKTEYYTETHTYAQIALSVIGVSSHNERSDLKEIIMVIDELCVLKHLFDPEGLPRELIDDIMRLVHFPDNTELSEKIRKELIDVLNQRKADGLKPSAFL